MRHHRADRTTRRGGPMSQTIDPVAAAEAYRASLLAALGDDDPAVVQAGTADALRALVRDAGDSLRIRPEPGEWSVLECIGHITDAELVVATRERWILAEDRARDRRLRPGPVGRPARAQRRRSGAPDRAVRGAPPLEPRSLGAPPGSGSRADRPAPGARRRELRPDLPPGGRPRSHPPRAGASRARGRPAGALDLGGRISVVQPPCPQIAEAGDHDAPADARRPRCRRSASRRGGHARSRSAA